MTRDTAQARRMRDEKRRAGAEGPFVWTFDGPFRVCLNDMEDTFRRALVQIGDVARIVVMIELSLPALRARVHAGDAIQPAWRDFLDALMSRYGLPAAPHVRYSKTRAALATLVIAYRS